MYRKKYLYGCCLCCLGLGLLLGYALDSWFLCWGGGLGLILFGLFGLQKK